MYHFFVKEDQISEKEIRIIGSDVNHIRNVLRMKEGEEIRVSNGVDKDFRCRIRLLSGDSVTAEILSQEEGGAELPSRIYLFQGLPKSDKMELIIQKAVELGVYEIIPVATKRAVVKLDPKKEESKIRRWNTIAESAAKQSGRLLVPQVTKVMSMSEALRYGRARDLRLMPYENERGIASLKEAAESLRPGMEIAVFIGPEGGFEESEVEAAKAEGFLPVSLGKRILRTETAGLTTLSILMFWLECSQENRQEFQ